MMKQDNSLLADPIDEIMKAETFLFEVVGRQVNFVGQFQFDIHSQPKLLKDEHREKAIQAKGTDGPQIESQPQYNAL